MGDISNFNLGNGESVNFKDSAARTALDSKASKVNNATNGNFAGLDANGNLTDSGKKASDFLPSNTPIPSITNCYQSTDTAEITLVDDDYIPFYDTSATAKKKSTWANIKAKLTTFFNTIYSNVHVYVGSLDIYNAYIGLSSGRQRIDIDTGQYTGLYTINGTSYIEQEVTLGTTDTTVTFDSYWIEYTPEGGEFTRYYFNDNTIISKLLVGRSGSDVVGGQNQFPYKSMYIANNVLTIVFPALSSAVNVKVRVYIDNYE